MLVEIERPGAQLVTKSGDYAETVRRAIRQVKDWRAWFLGNLELAARPRSKGGLGLHDISRLLMGHVIVGRRANASSRFNQLRAETLQNEAIDIVTYDRLATWARKRAEFWDGYTRSGAPRYQRTPIK